MKSYNQVQTKFRTLFPESLPPNKITTRTLEIIEAVRQALETNQGRISARRNGLGILPSWLCQIIKKDLRWYPCKMIRRHNLKDGYYERRSRFCQWLLHQCNNGRFLANFLNGGEAGFVLNDAINHFIVRMYTPENEPPDFHYNANDSRQKCTVWMGLCGNSDILGPFFFDRNVNRQSCLNL